MADGVSEGASPWCHQRNTEERSREAAPQSRQGGRTRGQGHRLVLGRMSGGGEVSPLLAGRRRGGFLEEKACSPQAGQGSLPLFCPGAESFLVHGKTCARVLPAASLRIVDAGKQPSQPGGTGSPVMRPRVFCTNREEAVTSCKDPQEP